MEVLLHSPKFKTRYPACGSFRPRNTVWPVARNRAGVSAWIRIVDGCGPGRVLRAQVGHGAL